MSRVLPIFILPTFVWAALVVGSSQIHAGLIMVRFDDFTSTTANTTIFSGGGFTIDRTVLTGGTGFFGGAVGVNGVLGAGTVDVEYTISGGDFEDLFNFYKTGAPASPKGTFNPSTNGVFDGFGVDIGTFVPGTVASVTVDNGIDPAMMKTITGIGFHDFRPLFANTTTVKVSLSATSGIFTMNSVYAVPEPTSVLLVGTVLIGICSVRRRK